MKHTNGIKISTHLNNPLLLKNFPNAKFVESEDIELEDHMIVLNAKLSIQLCFYSQDYCLTKDNDDDTFSNWEFNDFNSAINQSIK
jgi:hypothetical protein